MAGFAFVENESNDDFCQVSKRGNSRQFGFQHWWYARIELAAAICYSAAMTCQGRP
jgi:hypothetical protein